MNIYFKSAAVCSALILFVPLLDGASLPPQKVRITFSERTLDITWDTVPNAAGYNIYTASSANLPIQKKLKVNRKLITSGSHFAYIWHFEDGNKVRKIKGFSHYISITALFTLNGTLRESAQSKEVNNNYFEGFDRMDSRTSILKILQPSQHKEYIPVKLRSNKKKDFISFMEGPGTKLIQLLKKHIDPTETGGCVPVSTVLVKALDNSGLHAYRIEGNFIKEFHSFVIINIDNVEYVLDFTADQFYPDVTPVCIPRDFCNLNETGKLSKNGIPVYSIAKIYDSEQTVLNPDSSAAIYRKILHEVIK